MTGSTITLDLSQAEQPLLELLTNLDSRATHLGPAWQEIGDYLRTLPTFVSNFT